MSFLQPASDRGRIARQYLYFEMPIMAANQRQSAMLEEAKSDPKLRYTKIQELGEGSFGNVWLVRSNYSFRTYVRKEMNERCKDGKERDAALNEANILARLKHKNIIRYKDAYFDDGRLCIIMEYADDGDLYTKIKKRNGRKFDSNQILNWFVQLAMAVKYIHDQNILHRDLKSQNIFLTVMGILKVGDFGISRLLGCTSDHAKTVVGTPYYLSPEICRRELYNQKSDIWSLGVILYEITMLTYPFVGKTLSELVTNILVGNFAPVESTSPLICDLVLIMLQLKASDRPSATDILHIPAVTAITKSFLNKVTDQGNKARKESFSSPLIVRKRDKSFKYDVIFDLTCDHNLNENSSDGCKKAVVHGDRSDLTDENHCKLRNISQDAEVDQHIGSRMLKDAPSILDYRTLVEETAPVFTDAKNMEDFSKFKIRKRSDISRKRTFTLDRGTIDTVTVVKSRRSSYSSKAHHENVQDVAGDFSFENPVSCTAIDCKALNALDESSCINALRDNDVKKNCRVLTHDSSTSPSYVESVGAMTYFSNLFPHVDEKEGKRSERNLHVLESNQRIYDNVSTGNKTVSGRTFIISKLSPKIRDKVIGRARKINAKNFDVISRADGKEKEKSNHLKEEVPPSSKDEKEFSFSQNRRNLTGCAKRVEKPSNMKEHVNEYGKAYGNNKEIGEKDCKIQPDARGVLVFVDDAEFFPAKDQDSDACFLPKGRYFDESSLQHLSKQVESKVDCMAKHHERMEKLKLELGKRIGKDELKIICDFLRKRKLALLEDEVLYYANEILGEEIENILPIIVELLLLEKRLLHSHHLCKLFN